MGRVGWPCAWLVIAVACTRPNPAATCPDGTCIDPGYAFCDVHGAISGEPGRCLAVDCEPGVFAACDGDSALICNATGDSYETAQCGGGCDEATGCRPFCSPGAAISCANDQQTTCNAQGTATTTENCALGCSAVETRCLTFEPSNGLGPSLASSGNEPDITLPAGTRIDTDLGVVQDANGTVLAIKSLVVDQVGGPQIRVFEAHSFAMMDVTVSGAKPIAFVARGSIHVSGKLSVRASAQYAGAGAQSSTSCNGTEVTQYACACAPMACSRGGGGGGNFQKGGGGGGGNGTNGGSPLTSYSPLVGGCAGGSQRDPSGNIFARAGGGGGAIQIVSLNEVILSGAGLIDVGGGGGQSTTGGGSGGLVIIEAPQVSISGATAGIAANGGAGGGCNTTGADSTPDANPALGAQCAVYFSGRGGTGYMAPGNGCVIGVDSCVVQCPVIYGGGGGAAGRMRVVTSTGTLQTTGSPIMSVNVASATLVTR